MENNSKRNVQEIKFGLTKKEFEETAKQILSESGDYVKIAFGINENCELGLTFSSVSDSETSNKTENFVGDDSAPVQFTLLPCPPNRGCPPKGFQ